MTAVEMRRIGHDLEANTHPRETHCGLSSFLCKDVVQMILAASWLVAIGIAVYTYYKGEYPAAIGCTVLLIIGIIAYARIGCLKPEADLDDQVERTENRVTELDRQNKLAQQNIRTLEDSLAKVQADLLSKVKENEVLSAERYAQLAKVEDLLKQLDTTQKQFDQVTTLYNKIKEALKTTTSTVSELNQTTKSTDKVLDQLNKQSSSLSDSADDLHSSVNDLEKETKEYVKETKELDHLIKSLTSQLHRLEEVLKRITAEKEALEKAAVQVNRLDQAGSKIQEHVKKEQELEAKLVKLTEKLTQKYEEYQKLKSQVELLKNSQKT